MPHYWLCIMQYIVVTSGAPLVPRLLPRKTGMGSVFFPIDSHGKAYAPDIELDVAALCPVCVSTVCVLHEYCTVVCPSSWV